MQLTPMKHAVIEGVEVRVTAATLPEAKLAVKELRHKKRELALLKRVLAAQLKAANNREERTKPVTWGATAWSLVTRGFWGLLGMASAVVTKKRRRSAGEIAKEIEAVATTSINIDHAILQIEGRMLGMG